MRASEGTAIPVCPKITVMDGDEQRRLLSSELGFTREHRRLNVLRHAYVASELCRHRAAVICALIAPYAADRREMRSLIETTGDFYEIHLCTPLAVCEQRDPKRLYAQARAGELTRVTGIDAPYETPENPELTLDTGKLSVDECVWRIARRIAPSL